MIYVHIKDKDYLRTYGIYKPGSLINFIVNKQTKAKFMMELHRLVFDEELKVIKFIKIRDYGYFDTSEKKTISILLDPHDTEGYYLLIFKNANINYAKDIIISEWKNSDIAVIKPVFTQWAYHKNGFYYSEDGITRDLAGLLDRFKAHGYPLSLIERILRTGAKAVGYKKILWSFPVNKSINLNDFYIQNKNWIEKWRSCIGQEFIFDGLWCDEWTSTFPLYALLDKNKMKYDVFSDIDIHNNNSKLEKYKLIIFYGQEGITKSYYEYLIKLSRDIKIPLIVWGVQGFGYRQYEYIPDTGKLTYLCTRGKNGLWGDRLEDREPVWGNEGELFGFQFPEPDSCWGYNQWAGHKPLYTNLNIANDKHWLIKESGLSHIKTYTYFMDVFGQQREGLTGLGGEIQKKFKPAAEVIACLDKDQDIIGVGEYKNIITFSPTYWPIYFAYQNYKHPEIEKLFSTAVKHFISSKSPS